NLDNPIFKIIYKYFKQKELDFLKVSAHVISLTHAAKAELLSWNVITADKIQVIPCCADLVHFNIPSIDKRREVRKLLGLVESDLVFSYIGSLGTWYMVDEMLDLFQRIKTTYPQSKLLLITTHTQQEIKQYLSQTQIHPNDVILKSGTRVEMPLLIAASDISMFFVRPTFSKKASSPTKMAEIMGCGLPIICNTDIGDVEEIVTDTQCGYCTADFSKTSKDEIIRNIPNLLALDPIKIREGALKYFSLDEGIQKYNNVYLSVASCVKEK
ncbi:MAG TPA: glycosyltransferase, partial [Cytophagales bacterium]|nr:glycosyltransferase [Cytophagales bacterium]